MLTIEVHKVPGYWAIDMVLTGLNEDPANSKYVEKQRTRLGEVYRSGESYVAFDLAGNSSRAKTLERAVSKRLEGITTYPTRSVVTEE